MRIMKTIQDKIIQLMEEKCLNFQKERQYEKELEKELKQVDRIIDVGIDGDPFDSEYWNMRVYVTCGNVTEVRLKLKELFPTAKFELFPTAKFEDDGTIPDVITLVTAHIEGNVKQEPNVDE